MLRKAFMLNIGGARQNVRSVYSRSSPPVVSGPIDPKEPLSASERQSGWVLGDAAPELQVYFGNTLSIFRMIRSAH